jgi:predicted ATPase
MRRHGAESQAVPRIEYLRVQNYRVLSDVELRHVTPLTVFLGPNGSGKSTVFDVFAFLSECFTDGLRRAWDRRGRFKELRSRGQEGDLTFELKYRESPGTPVITYHLAIKEEKRGPKDAPFERPVLARFASDGTLKLLAYLTLLYDPSPPLLIGIEEPENYLHPRLLPELTEECRKATARTQLLVTTHSPFFVNGLRPQEVWVLYRDESGFTQARRVEDMPRVRAFLDAGALLGHLWMEGQFDVRDPLTASGGPRNGRALLRSGRSPG